MDRLLTVSLVLGFDRALSPSRISILVMRYQCFTVHVCSSTSRTRLKSSVFFWDARIHELVCSLDCLSPYPQTLEVDTTYKGGLTVGVEVTLATGGITIPVVVKLTGLAGKVSQDRLFDGLCRSY